MANIATVLMLRASGQIYLIMGGGEPVYSYYWWEYDAVVDCANVVLYMYRIQAIVCIDCEAILDEITILTLNSQDQNGVGQIHVNP